MIEVWGLESHAVEWRIQRSRWMFKGYPRRKKADGGTRRVPGWCLPQAWRARPDPGAKGDSESLSVCLEVCPVWVGKV